MELLVSKTAVGSSVKPLRGLGLLAAMALTSFEAYAQTGSGSGSGSGSGGSGSAFNGAHIKGVIDGLDSFLSGLSIVVVTVAFVFVGYQVAFGGKHFRDVMPVVIGAIIIGAAAQLAAAIATRA